MFRPRLAEATRSGPTRGTWWGVYAERFDGECWTPIIDPAMSKREALVDMELLLSMGLYRNVRLVRRTVTPWTVA